MYKCPGCGAALRFDPKSQMMACDHCQKLLSPKDPTLQHVNLSYGGTLAAEAPAGTFPSIVYTCPNCGGDLLALDETAATFCNYCGSNVTLEGRLEHMEAPNVIIPFQLDKEDCKKAYKKLLRRAIFAPSYVRKDEEIEKFRGIYMPYWIYSYRADGETKGTGTTSHRSGNYVITDHYDVYRDVRATYEGLSYDAASDFSDVLSEAVAPYRAVGAEPFAESYMSGFYADVSDVDKAVYEADAAEVAKDYVVSETMSDPEYIRKGVTRGSVTVPLESAEQTKGYFPVWFLANQTPDKKSVSYAVVNGETGKIAAELPIAFWKYLLASLAVAVPLFFLLNNLLVLTPSRMLVATIVISVITLIVLNVRFNRTFDRKDNSSDRGLQFRLRMTKARVAAENSEKPENARKKAKEEAEQTEKKKKTVSVGVVMFWIMLFLMGAGILYAFSQADSSVAYTIIHFSVFGAVAVFVVYIIISSIIETRKKKLSSKSPARKEKWKYLVKPLIGIAVSVIVILLNPVQDFWYYGAAILADLLVVWCALDAVTLYNQGTTRPLPQFGTRGGTGNE